jgi:hypothetical protein
MATQRRNRQVSFAPMQTHNRGFELALIAISVICVIVVLVIVLFTGLGTEFRPKA